MPIPTAPIPSAEFLKRCLDVLRDRGFTRVVTGALTPIEQVGFLDAGFAVAERLHLLDIDCGPELPAPPPGLRLRPVRRRDHAAVLRVDALAFSSFWQLDRSSLVDAMTATPHTRARAAVATGGLLPPRAVTGYAICGWAGHRGFVQRLAVDPSSQGRGTGRRLLLDGLAWMRDHGVRRAVVNTQVGNEVALALYQAVGFRQQPCGLSVLAAALA
jgi:ribosomal protein S18 acetylase RimI-like enzyme